MRTRNLRIDDLSVEGEMGTDAGRAILGEPRETLN